MAWGLPVIAVKKGGPAYLLNDKGAFWIRQDSQESIYNLFMKIINTEIDFDSMSQANRERAFELYNYPVSEKLLEIYKSIFGQ
jgi:glycosyltransferase involved in cell wall biosynthesis